MPLGDFYSDKIKIYIGEKRGDQKLDVWLSISTHHGNFEARVAAVLPTAAGSESSPERVNLEAISASHFILDASTDEKEGALPCSCDRGLRLSYEGANQTVYSEIREYDSGYFDAAMLEEQLDSGSITHRGGIIGQQQLRHDPSLDPPSISAELKVFGVSSILDGVARRTDPVPVPLAPYISLEGVTSIACSNKHVLLLTCMGTVYSMGHNAEGALGVGDVNPRGAFSLVPFPDAKTGSDGAPPKINRIAAGSGAIGSHSCAVSSTGDLYVWGAAYICGLGTSKPVLEPTLLPISSAPDPDQDNLEAEDVERILEEAEAKEEEDGGARSARAAAASEKILDVGCGAGFTVAVLQGGRVASWGIWAHGVLGLGMVPKSANTSNRARKRMARFQMKPSLILGLKNISMVACGEAHTLCVSDRGYLLAWGRNSAGQLGTGVTESGLLLDHYRPVRVEPFGPADAESSSQRRAVLACCGARHSLVLDQRGCLHSWGALGGAGLGHCDRKLPSAWSALAETVFPAYTHQNATAIPYELLDWSRTWSRPRELVVANHGDRKIVQLSAGESHSAYLLDDGFMYLFGDAPVVPKFIAQQDEVADDATAETFVTADDPEAFSVSTETPRCPSSAWLPSLCKRKTVLLASGGKFAFALQDKDFVCDVSYLLQKETLEDIDSKSFHLLHGNKAISLSTDRELTQNHFDCMIVAAGVTLHCHRAVLSCRSPRLRDMIIEESTEDSGFVCELLLPGLLNVSACALLYFLYTDSLPRYCIGDARALRSLANEAKKLEIMRLYMLCEQLLVVLHNSEEDLVDSLHSNVMSMVVPPGTLARDMGQMIDDSSYADVRFVVQGREVFAHRFILEMHAYFQAMFRFSQPSSGGADGTKRATTIDIVIPDSYESFTRFLFYLYTRSLPPGPSSQALDDFMLADRYDVKSLRALAESMLGVSRGNWLDMFRLTGRVEARRLRAEMLVFLREHYREFSYLCDRHEDFAGGGSSTGTTVLDEVLQAKRLTAMAAPPNGLETYSSKREELISKHAVAANAIPWSAIAMVFALTLIYYAMTRFVNLGGLIPLFNIVGIALFFVGMGMY
jgi:alpha-tubulin suppressor-like RCC1 family protein